MTCPETNVTAAIAAWDRREVLERYLGQQIQRERHALEQGLTVLASIANVAPFVGLFGTVFGIIHTLQAITAATSSGAEMVAGPIGQALVATGIGIGVAIPAVVAYNVFLRRVNVTLAGLDDYAINLVNLAQRSGFRIEPAAKVVTDKVSPLAHTRDARS
jgi:biopolymer transport protein ExbB